MTHAGMGGAMLVMHPAYPELVAEWTAASQAAEEACGCWISPVPGDEPLWQEATWSLWEFYLLASGDLDGRLVQEVREVPPDKRALQEAIGRN
jgi:hypothetical protein